MLNIAAIRFHAGLATSRTASLLLLSHVLALRRHESKLFPFRLFQFLKSRLPGLRIL